MKTLKKFGFLFVMVAGAAMAFTSCGSDDPEKEPITLNFDSDRSLGFYFEDATVVVGARIKIGARITSEEKIEKVEFIRTEGTQTTTIEDVLDVNEKIFNKDFSYTASLSANTVETLTVIVTDKKGNTKKRDIIITTKASGEALSLSLDQEFFNFIGLKEGAYDLTSLKSVASTEPDAIKDLMDQTTKAKPTFSKSWGTRNGAKFVYNPKVTFSAFKAEGKTKTDLETLWTDNEGSSTSLVSGLKEGDLILVKTAKGNHYLINLHTITEDAIGNNDGYKFDIVY